MRKCEDEGNVERRGERCERLRGHRQTKRQREDDRDRYGGFQV